MHSFNKWINLFHWFSFLLPGIELRPKCTGFIISYLHLLIISSSLLKTKKYCIQVVVTEVTAHIFHIFNSFCEQKFVSNILKPLEQYGCVSFTPEEKRLVNCLISLSLNDYSSCLTLREMGHCWHSPEAAVISAGWPRGTHWPPFHLPISQHQNKAVFCNTMWIKDKGWLFLYQGEEWKSLL